MDQSVRFSMNLVTARGRTRWQVGVCVEAGSPRPFRFGVMRELQSIVHKLFVAFCSHPHQAHQRRAGLPTAPELYSPARGHEKAASSAARSRATRVSPPGSGLRCRRGEPGAFTQHAERRHQRRALARQPDRRYGPVTDRADGRVTKAATMHRLHRMPLAPRLARWQPIPAAYIQDHHSAW